MLPGREKALLGLEKGAKKEGVLKAAEAFGDLTHSPHKQMKRSDFPEGAKLKAGERFTAKGARGGDVVLLINKVDGTTIDVQFLHPLGDKDLKYSVEVLSVTDP